MRNEQMTGVILAGGASARMGRDKSRLMIHGESLLDRATRVMTECFSRTITIRDDDQPGLGPIGGIATAWRQIETESMFVVACDMPFLNAELIRAMASEWRERDEAVAVRVDGRFEPLHAVYHRSCEAVVNEQIGANERSMQRLLQRLKTRELGISFLDDFGDWRRALMNVNTPGDWESIKNARP